jgi:DNA-binding transcriptional LysR family regulator
MMGQEAPAGLNLAGIQAAVSAGLGVSILPEMAILPDHRALGSEDGSPSTAETEVALVITPARAPPPAALPTSWSNSAPRPVREGESRGFNQAVFFLL